MAKEHNSKGSTKPVLLYASNTEPQTVEGSQGMGAQQVAQEPPKQEPPKQEPEKVLDFKNANDAYEHFKDQSNEWYDSLTPSEKQAVGYYTGSGYGSINDALRAEGKDGTPLSSEMAKTKNRLNSALAKFDVKDTVILYRGAFKSCVPKFAQKDPTKLIGKTYFDNGFMSCGASADKGWNRPVHFVITVPKGSKGAGAYVGKNSSVPTEGEYLLRSNSHFTVTDAQKDSGGEITITMTLIPGKYNLVSKPQAT